MKEFNLSDWLMIRPDDTDGNKQWKNHPNSIYIPINKVKEFIRLLKEEFWINELIIKRINKLAGDKLSSFNDIKNKKKMEE